MSPLLVIVLLSWPQSTSKPDSGVTSRGDHAMGFSHELTTHHFRLYPSGGAIEVLANDPKDSNSRDQIRMHLSHVVRLFSAGDFNVPMFIHDKMPPGSQTMTRLKDQIHYRLAVTAAGGRIRITSRNPEAIEAIHEFLRFQIADHKTDDSAEVMTPKNSN